MDQFSPVEPFEFAITETVHHDEFRHIVRTIARMMDVPLVMIVSTEHGQKSMVSQFGFDIDALPNCTDFGDCTLELGRTLVVPNALADPDFADCPLVTEEFALRFYAGTPLIDANGQMLGTLCTLDKIPRSPLTADQTATFEDMAKLVADRMLMQRSNRALLKASQRDAIRHKLLRLVVEAPDFACACNAAMQYLREMTGAAFCGLFRLTDDRTRVTMVVGAAQTARGSAAYAASVREVAMTLDNTMAGRAIRTGEQLIIKNIAETEKANALNNWLIENRSTACIATPLTMLDEREAFNLLFTEPMSDSTFLEEQAELARDAAIILGPMLRRVKDEANSRRFRRAVECSPDPVLITEAAPFAAPGSRVVYCNQAFLDLTGHHLDQVIGHCPRFLHGPGTEPDALKTLQTAMQAWEPVRQIITHYKADGTPFQVELNLAPVADSNGEYSHWVCIQRDVTFQVTQAAERDAHLRELRALLAVIPNAILQYHRDGPNVWRKAFVSDSIEMITGFTTTEASSVDWATKQMREEDLDLLRDNLELAYACGTATVEFRIRHRDGDLRLIQAKMCSYVGARGDTEVIATWTDVTRERRTAAQLDQAARLADLGELAAGLVHELNRPLAAMMLLSENALRALNKGPEYLGHVAGKLGAITKLAQQGADMVSHVQVFSRIDTGESAPIALNMLLNDLMILAQPKFLDSHVSVEFKIPADLPKIYVKPVPLEQVLINLISNSCDAYELATPRIDASQRKIWIDTHAEQNRVIIHVRDRAGGIPPQHLPFLFDAFFTTKPAGKGTGLGLSISSGIVREMGGNLSVFNDQGGAVFVLDLPTAGG